MKLKDRNPTIDALATLTRAELNRLTEALDAMREKGYAMSPETAADKVNLNCYMKTEQECRELGQALDAFNRLEGRRVRRGRQPEA